MSNRLSLRPGSFAPRTDNQTPVGSSERSQASIARRTERPANDSQRRSTVSQEMRILRPDDLIAPAKNVGQRLNTRQYLRHIDDVCRQVGRREARSATLDVDNREIERVAGYAAKLRGRYLAMVLELGSGKTPINTESEIKQLARARESYEEAEKGLAALKAAIESGEVMMAGVQQEG